MLRSFSPNWCMWLTSANIVAALRSVTRLSCAAHILKTVLHTMLRKPAEDDVFGVSAFLDSAKFLVTYFKQTDLQNRLKKHWKHPRRNAGPCYIQCLYKVFTPLGCFTLLLLLYMNIVVCTVSPILTTEAFNSFRVVVGVLVASLTGLLRAWSLSLWGRSALGRFKQVPYSFHFLMMDLTEICGMSREL